MLQVNPPRRGTCRHHSRPPTALVAQAAGTVDVNGRGEVLIMGLFSAEWGETHLIDLDAGLLYGGVD